MDTNKKGFDWWCDRMWIKVGCCITGVIVVAMLINWQTWSPALKCVFAIAALIPLHVVEEWVFPGGFNYQYNRVLYRSDVPDRYPMCRASDMFTNLGTTVMYAIFGIICLATGGNVPAGLVMGTLAFCVLEVCAHTAFGIWGYRTFQSAGKSTIYGPGSITAYLGFFPIGVIALYSLQGQVIGGMDWLMAIGVLAIIAVVWILIPENTLKRKDSPYFFETNGYFDRFLDKDGKRAA